MAGRPAPRPQEGEARLRAAGVALAVVGLVVVLLAGLWLVTSVLAPGYDSSIALGVAWFVVASIALRFVVGRRRQLRLPLRAAFLVTAAATAVAFYLTSVRDTEVNEEIATGAPAGGAGPAEPSPGGRGAPSRSPRGNVQLAEGRVTPAGHTASGTAAVVRLADGRRVLTLSSFEIDPGPMVHVYLVAGDPRSDAEVTRDFKDLGGLKGNRGNQQYEIPKGVDIRRYDTVIFWCVPFTQTLGRARLEAS